MTPVQAALAYVGILRLNLAEADEVSPREMLDRLQRVQFDPTTLSRDELKEVIRVVGPVYRDMDTFCVDVLVQFWGDGELIDEEADLMLQELVAEIEGEAE